MHGTRNLPNWVLGMANRQISGRRLREQVVQRATGVQVRGDTAREQGWPGSRGTQQGCRQRAGRPSWEQGWPARALHASRGAGSSAVQHCQVDTMSMRQVCRLATRVHGVLAKLRDLLGLRNELVNCLLPFLSGCITQDLSLTRACNPESLSQAYLNAVDPDPGRYQGQDACDQVHQKGRVIIAIEALLPELVQPCAADDQGRVDLQAGKAWQGSG